LCCRGQVGQERGWRLGTYRSFVEPILGKPGIDLTVVAYAHATKIILEDNKAVGVIVERFGDKLAYKAKKEVIATVIQTHIFACNVVYD